MRNVILGVLLLLLCVGCLGSGLFALIAAPTAARWNDTKGPAWVRDYNGTAYPGRTKAWHMRLLSTFLIPVGVFCGYCLVELTRTGRLQ